MSKAYLNFFSNKDMEEDKNLRIYDEFLDEDYKLEKPEVRSVEITIFLNRLIGIFEAVMAKLQFGATLPMILQHPILFHVLSKKEYKEVVSAFGAFPMFQSNSEQATTATSSCKHSESFSLMSCSKSKCCVNCCGYESEGSSTASKTATDIYNALQILILHKPIRQLSIACKNDIAKPTINFLRQMKYFMDFVISKSKLLPEEARNIELYYHNMCISIEKSKEEISDLIDSLEKQKDRHRAEATELAGQVNSAMATWENINKEFDNELAKILKDSEDSLAKSVEDFNERMEIHKQTLENLKKLVETQKLKNKKIEIDVLGKKFKVESQLLSIINNYDTEINNRQEAFDELMREYEALYAERTALMEEMDEQLKLYTKIKRDEQEKAFEAYREKYMRFVTNRCAKIIQRWWRKVVKILRKRRKKGKKGKKGKK